MGPVTWTFCPLPVQLPFQPELSDSVLAGNLKASVQPLMEFGPVLVMLMLAMYPLPQPWVTS